LKAIVAPTSVGIAAAARYISSSPSKGKVVVTGLGTPNQMRAFIVSNTFTPGAICLRGTMPNVASRASRASGVPGRSSVGLA
ncbi:hypothetical protein AB4Y33_43200, partial [Paraburkholderia sp. BR14319]